MHIISEDDKITVVPPRFIEIKLLFRPQNALTGAPVNPYISEFLLKGVFAKEKLPFYTYQRLS